MAQDVESLEAPTCKAEALLEHFGRKYLMVGANMTPATAARAPFDLRSIYLAGGLFDGEEPCDSCATGCFAGGQACISEAGCRWWGCWQWDQQPPGQHVRDFIELSGRLRQIPMISYYQILQTSGVGEGADEVAALNDPVLMKRYFNDWRFLLKIIGDHRVILHIEPDLWAFAQQTNSNPHRLPAAVSTANPQDCGSLEDSVAGFGQCMIAMVRRYAPNARVGLHASGWGTGVNAPYNRNPAFDVKVEAVKVARYLKECGADESDMVVLDVSDGDAGFHATQGKDTWWDATNASLPNYEQGFAWANAVSETLELPVLWWHVPLGNADLPNEPGRWKDNRVDYFFDHLEDAAKVCAIGVSFGAGAEGQTTPETDGGNLVRKTRKYLLSGGQMLRH